MNELETELEKMEQEFSYVDLSDDKQILKCSENINKALDRVDNLINYNLELNLLSMKIGVNEEIKNILFNNIQDSYHVDVEFLETQGVSPTVKHILQKGKFWSCICGELVKRIK